MAGTGQCSCLGHAPEGLCCFQGECALESVHTVTHVTFEDIEDHKVPASVAVTWHLLLRPAI